MDIRDHNVFADFFLICNGENERQLQALAENITFDAKKKADVKALGIEGEAKKGWVLIDFGDLVVHIFSPDKRQYYQIEDIWDRGHVVLHMQ